MVIALQLSLCCNIPAAHAALCCRLGHLPIMVKSKKCHLRKKSCAELVAAKEESLEMGGYFICNGIERIIRILILQVSSQPCHLAPLHSCTLVCSCCCCCCCRLIISIPA